MSDRRTMNWLLAGILIVLSLHLWVQMERPVSADTLRLDDCITERMQGIPRQWLHVVAHTAEKS